MSETDFLVINDGLAFMQSMIPNIILIFCVIILAVTVVIVVLKLLDSILEAYAEYFDPKIWCMSMIITLLFAIYFKIQ